MAGKVGPRLVRRAKVAALAASICLGLALAAAPAHAQSDDPAYQDRLLRLSEILGAVHHLRDICGDDEGQLWREQMEAILEAEDPPPQLRARLIAAFNNGFRSFQRTYASCTPSAKTAADRFFAEGSQIAVSLVQSLEAATGEGSKTSDEKAAPATGASEPRG